VQPSGKVAELLLELACAVMGRSEPKRSRANLFDPILSKLARRKAS
jgi:pilus assembly protein CpaE